MLWIIKVTTSCANLFLFMGLLELGRNDAVFVSFPFLSFRTSGQGHFGGLNITATAFGPIEHKICVPIQLALSALFSMRAE